MRAPASVALLCCLLAAGAWGRTVRGTSAREQQGFLGNLFGPDSGDPVSKRGVGAGGFLEGDRTGCTGCVYVWDAVRERMASQHPGLLKQLAGGAYMREAKTMLATLGRESATQLLNGLAPRAGEAVDAVALLNAEDSAVDDVEGRDEAEEQRAAAAAQAGGQGAGGEGADDDDGTDSLADSVASHALSEEPEAMLAQARKQMTLVYEDVCEHQPELFSDACDTMYQELNQYISLFPLIAQRCSYSLCQYKGMCGASARDPDFDPATDSDSQMMGKGDATLFGDNCME